MTDPKPYSDPDIRDPNEEKPAPRAAAPTRDPRLRRGTFNDGWTEVIKALHGTLTDEQAEKLLRRFEELTGRPVGSCSND